MLTMAPRSTRTLSAPSPPFPRRLTRSSSGAVAAIQPNHAADASTTESDSNDDVVIISGPNRITSNNDSSSGSSDSDCNERASDIEPDVDTAEANSDDDEVIGLDNNQVIALDDDEVIAPDANINTNAGSIAELDDNDDNAPSPPQNQMGDPALFPDMDLTDCEL